MKTLNNNILDMEYTLDNVSVISGGYIIRPDGKMVIVKDNTNHETAFSEYINKYLEKDNIKIHNTIEAVKILTDLKHCIYTGIRLEYIKNMYQNLDKIAGVFIFPKDICSLPEKQKISCRKIIESNKKIYKDEEIITVFYETINGFNFTKEDIIEKLQPKEKVNIKLF